MRTEFRCGRGLTGSLNSSQNFCVAALFPRPNNRHSQISKSVQVTTIIYRLSELIPSGMRRLLFHNFAVCTFPGFYVCEKSRELRSDVFNPVVQSEHSTVPKCARFCEIWAPEFTFSGGHIPCRSLVSNPQISAFYPFLICEILRELPSNAFNPLLLSEHSTDPECARFCENSTPEVVSTITRYNHVSVLLFSHSTTGSRPQCEQQWSLPLDFHSLLWFTASAVLLSELILL